MKGDNIDDQISEEDAKMDSRKNSKYRFCFLKVKHEITTQLILMKRFPLKKIRI